MSDEPSHGLRAEPELGRSFWIGLALGLPILGFGAYGLLNDVRSTHVDSWARFFVGFLVAHDVVLVPLVLVVGALVSRLVPARARPAVQATLILGALVLAVAIPVLFSPARPSGNPSILPLPYERNLGIVEAVVLGVGLVLGVLAWRRSRRGAS